MFVDTKTLRVTSKGPASVRVASSKSALRGFESPTNEIVRQAAKAIPYLIVGGIVVYGIYRYSNRFVKLKENPNYPVANITLAQASTKATAIKNYNSFDDVSNNLRGLNYNGFVRVYNAFGQTESTSVNPGSAWWVLICPVCNLFDTTDTVRGDMITWIKEEFSEDQVEELSFLFNGQFF